MHGKFREGMLLKRGKETFKKEEGEGARKREGRVLKRGRRGR
jgi:hypothetical protein